MLQSPLRFGILIAVLAFINTSAAKQLQGFAVPQVLFEWAGLACLPLVWTLVSALARGAENGGKTWPVLLDFVRNLYDHLGPGRSDPLVVSRVVSALRERREAVEELGTRHIPGYIRKRVTAVVRQD